MKYETDASVLYKVARLLLNSFLIWRRYNKNSCIFISSCKYEASNYNEWLHSLVGNTSNILLGQTFKEGKLFLYFCDKDNHKYVSFLYTIVQEKNNDIRFMRSFYLIFAILFYL